MSKGRRPLTLFEREQIESWLIRLGRKKKWMAEKLKRDYFIIKREIKRNSGAVLPYNAEAADYYATRRKKKTNKRKLDKWQNEKLKKYVETNLNEGWSPEEIAGKLKNQPPEGLEECKDKCP
jgi:IS30 family transposase